MEIAFDRNVAFKRFLLGDVHRFIWKLISIYGAKYLLSFMEININSEIIKWGLFIAVLSSIWAVFVSYKISKTLKYEFEVDKHTQTWEVITKQRNQARTQVVNDVSISQDFFDKLFGIFTLTINYGFGDEGYDFDYDFLTENQALELENKIKTTAKAIKIN